MECPCFQVPESKPEDGATPCLHGDLQEFLVSCLLGQGVVVLERKESLEKEFPTGRNQWNLCASKLELRLLKQRVIFTPWSSFICFTLGLGGWHMKG